MITVIDYGVGNLKSLRNALKYLSTPYAISSNPDEVARAEKLILPGVGAFGFAMQCMNEHGLAETVVECARAGTPILGICLGMQLLFTRSEEGGGCKGLDLVPGTVRRFTGALKVPHMGWNEVVQCGDAKLLANSPDSQFAYFVHSYYCVPDDPEAVAGITDYGVEFCSVVQQKNVLGAQFHPEKSQEFGLNLLKNFAEV